MFKKLGSVQITIVLLVLLVVSSIVGTLVPQGLTEGQYQNKYGANLYGFLKNLQLLDVYHSYWYTALLAIFCIHLVICSTLNLKPLISFLRRPTPTDGPDDLSKMSFYKDISLGSKAKKGIANEVILKIRSIYARRLYQLKYFDASKGVYYFEKGKIGRLGPLITHASVVIILIGGILVGRLGFRDYMNVPIGKTMDVPHSSFQIRADDFKMELYPNSQTPKTYRSVLTIIENGEQKVTKPIEVNHPLEYKGVNFYQSSYGTLDDIMPDNVMSDSIAVELSKKSPNKPEGEVIGTYKVGIGQDFLVPNTQLHIKVANYYPDFVMDNSGNIGTRSNEPKNPAALLELYEGSNLKLKSWIFEKFPDFHGASKSEYSLRFSSSGTSSPSGSSGYYTGLQVSKSPFLSVVWTGFFLMVMGMFLSFYLQYKQIWIKLSADKVEMGGSSYKSRSGFDKEFEQLNALFSNK